MFMSQAHLDSQAKYSTEIRRAIDSGNIEKAMTMLEREGTNKINVQVSSFITFLWKRINWTEVHSYIHKKYLQTFTSKFCECQPYLCKILAIYHKPCRRR